MSNLLILCLLAAGAPETEVIFRNNGTALQVEFNCPECPECPCPELASGNVIPSVLNAFATYIRTSEYDRPELYDLEAWRRMQVLPGPVTHYYALTIAGPINGTAMATLCADRDMGDDPLQVQYCTFAHLASLHITRRAPPRWWADFDGNGVVDLRDFAEFQNRFGGGDDGE